MLALPSGKRPTASISTLEEWEEYISTFPLKIKQVTLSGGEPTLVPYLDELINWLLERKYHVLVYSNLYNPEAFDNVKQSRRFKILSTFHEEDNRERFIDAWLKLRDRFEVEITELDTKYIDSSTRFRKVLSSDDSYMKCSPKSNGLLVSPDRQLFRDCYEHCIEKSRVA